MTMSKDPIHTRRSHRHLIETTYALLHSAGAYDGWAEGTRSTRILRLQKEASEEGILPGSESVPLLWLRYAQPDYACRATLDAEIRNPAFALYQYTSPENLQRFYSWTALCCDV